MNRHTPPVRPTLTYAEAFELLDAIRIAYTAASYAGTFTGQHRGRLTRTKAKLETAIREGFDR